MGLAMDTSITNDGRVKETSAARGRSFSGGVAAPAKALARDLPRSVAARYGTALLLVAVALSATLAVQRLFVFPYPFLFLFFGAVMASAWFGGVGAGPFAGFVSPLGGGFFFFSPPFPPGRTRNTLN